MHTTALPASALPLTRDLVLVGGGHTHALVLRAWGMNPLPGARLTLINPGPTAPYSGMLPGHLAGHYTRDALDIDLVRLARFAGARLVLGYAEGIDLAARTIHVPGRAPIGFDVASIDVGITSDMPSLPGFAEHAVPAKPLGPFASRWSAFLEGSGPAAVAVIGGGVAGVEIAMALAHALQSANRPAQVRLLERGKLLSGLRPSTVARLRQALQAQGVEVLEGVEITEVTTEGVTLADGQKIEADFITGAAGARPHGWIAGTGLATEDGFITVDPQLRSSDPDVFAVGDCAFMRASPRPKAGVYAVRQAPVLAHNLLARLIGQGGLRRYTPQKDYLKLISLGRKSALADRFGIALQGPALWRWKDRIDQAFMDKFRNLPAMPPPALPWPRAAEVKEALGPKPMCGGCGAKLGRDALSDALAALPPPIRADVTPLPGDDAALLLTGCARQIFSTDHLRALTNDPEVMARIATIHALGDVWAMGAAPQAVTLNITLPRMSAPLARRSMQDILTATAEVTAAAGADIVGGHSTFGDELVIGLAVTGLCEDAPITLSGAKPGDHLILTKPLGTGVIMAAEMQMQARGEWVPGCLLSMTQVQSSAAQELSGANAMTDVTGFGLWGHLRGICEASGVGARIDLGAVPLLPGAEKLAQQGIRSSLFPQNRALAGALPDTAQTDLLFDPQTAGGLLAAVAGDAQPLVARLQEAGYTAAIIGKITDESGQISMA
ncbi:MAG: selenide, water dikinase SelD [Paracoccaceae bacterium]|nr:selenide, water dikinase SelD [Paracoccaceae bacterium]